MDTVVAVKGFPSRAEYARNLRNGFKAFKPQTWIGLVAVGVALGIAQASVHGVVRGCLSHF